MANCQEKIGCQWKRGDASEHIKAPNQALTAIMEGASPSLLIQGWVGDKPCLMTVDIGVYVTVARPNTAVGWPEKTAKPTVHVADSIWRNPIHLEGCFPDNDPEAAPTESSGICPKIHKQVHLEAGQAAHI
jgi:hypothetical protein